MLENPDLISKTVLAKGLDAGTAFEILSIDIADVDVGKNIGAELQTDQAEADKRIAQAKAEERRALAVAIEQEFKAEAQNQRAKVIAAEAQIPLAIAEAFRSGNLGVMDYQRYRNIQADTTHADRDRRRRRQRAAVGRLSGGLRPAAAARVHVAGGERHPQGGEQAAGPAAASPPRAAPAGPGRAGARRRSRRSPEPTRPSGRGAGSRTCSGSWAARSTRPRARAGRPTGSLPPGAEEVEERESLEVIRPRCTASRRDPRREERAVDVDQDDEAERMVGAADRGRRKRRCRVLTTADHPTFDARIRQEPADTTATRGYTVRQLRDAVVWREILGPPVSLREEDER